MLHLGRELQVDGAIATQGGNDLEPALRLGQGNALTLAILLDFIRALAELRTQDEHGRIAGSEVEAPRIHAAPLRGKQRLQAGRCQAAHLADAEAILLEDRFALQRNDLLVGIGPEFLIEEGIAQRAFEKGNIDLNDIGTCRSWKGAKALQP